jgi:hypothetical protein
MTIETRFGDQYPDWRAIHWRIVRLRPAIGTCRLYGEPPPELTARAGASTDWPDGD